MHAESGGCAELGEEGTGGGDTCGEGTGSEFAGITEDTAELVDMPE